MTPRLLRAAGPLAALAAATLLVLARLRHPDALDPDALLAALPAARWWTPLAYVGAFTLATLALIPTSPLAFAAGLIFGPVFGWGYAMAGAMAGALAAYVIARGAGPHLARLLRRRAARAAALLDAHGVRAVMASRLLFLPFGPVSYALGLAGVRAPVYAWGTLLGILPLVTAFVLLGSALGDVARLREPGFAAALAAATLAAAAGAWRQPAPAREPEAVA